MRLLLVKKNLFLILFLVSTLILVFTSANYKQFKNTQQTKTNLAVVPNSDASDIDNKCHETNNLMNKLPSNWNKSSDSSKKTLDNLKNESDFVQLEKSALTNTKCGADSASTLIYLYQQAGLLEKANEYHRRSIEYASSGNTYAIMDICNGYDTLATIDQKLHFCDLIMNGDNQRFNKYLKFAAFSNLIHYYFENDQGDKLFDLCKVSGEYKYLCMLSPDINSVYKLAFKLREEKKYDEAITLYKKIAPYDDEGLVQFEIAIMYQSGEGVTSDIDEALYWYNEILQKSHDSKVLLPVLNNIGNLYQKKLDYKTAFQFYERAAMMGNSLSQMNLAIMYWNGYGTIQDYQKAYAWISLAVSNGLDDLEKQNKAESIRDLVVINLRHQDNTDTEYHKAKSLASQYYKKYVLHEQSTSNSSLTHRIGEAIKVLTD